MLSSREKLRKNKSRDQKKNQKSETNKKEETSLSKKISDLAESAIRFFTKKKAWSKDSESKYAKLSSYSSEFATWRNLLILFRLQALNVQRETRFIVLNVLFWIRCFSCAFIFDHSRAQKPGNYRTTQAWAEVLAKTRELSSQSSSIYMRSVSGAV